MFSKLRLAKQKAFEDPGKVNSNPTPSFEVWNWIGPPSPNFLLDNQTNALTALVAAIPLRNDSIATEEPTPSPPNSDTKASPNFGAIAGGCSWAALRSWCF
ncbi:hypothetical protein VNI00_013897 [Paramarasmius palmivorus]|uniref:Uncharacterized protein n=1 Tax=Paramarasmius palmivorus TaxID=297713 RepID=A0AAW0BVT1_9AGAR